MFTQAYRLRGPLTPPSPLPHTTNPHPPLSCAFTGLAREHLGEDRKSSGPFAKSRTSSEPAGKVVPLTLATVYFQDNFIFQNQNFPTTSDSTNAGPSTQ